MNAMWRMLLGALMSSSALAAPANSDMDKIRLLESRYAAALVVRDLDAVMRTYSPAEDLFIFEAVPPRQFVGAKAYRQHVQEFLVNFQAPFTYEVHEVAVTIT